jgi:DNA gyrase subunit B
MSKKSYSASDIEILEDLEHVRKRPAMYVGDTGTMGLHHIVKEVIDNAIDEYMEGHVSKVRVYIDTEEPFIEVRDNGRGIPIEVHEKSGESTLITVFTKLHAGGKFDKTGAYSRPIVGLHGIGVKATNALSEWMAVWTYDPHTKKVYEIGFYRGEPDFEEPKESDFKMKKGLVVQFKPDPKVFKKAKLDPQRIRLWLKNLAYLCPGLKLSFQVDDEKPETFLSEKGLSEMLKLATSSIELYHEPFVMETESFDLALVWSDQRGEHWKSFINTSPTPEHGTHVKGVQKAIRNVYKQEGKSFRSEDLRDGLIAVIHARVGDPEFRGQTKVRLENKSVEEEIATAVEEKLRQFAVQNKKLTKDILERAIRLASARKKFRAEQEAIKGTTITKGKKGILPGKLCEAPDCPPQYRELFIVEGKSAFGTVKNARLMLNLNGKRQVHFQEILPLRGKIKNAARCGLNELFQHEEVKAVAQAIGTGVDASFNISKLRCKAVYLLSDADADGQHINALLLAFFTKYMPDLIDAERVFVVLAPLFMGVAKNERAYGDTIEEVKTKLGTDKCRITRFKGLGESNAEDLRIYAMDPKTRRVMQVRWEGDEDKKLVLLYMSEDTAARKQLLGVIE